VSNLIDPRIGAAFSGSIKGVATVGGAKMAQSSVAELLAGYRQLSRLEWL